MKAIINYRLHPSIIAIKEKCMSSFSFNLSQVESDKIIKKINNLKINKVTQSTVIPTKLIKKNFDILEILFSKTLTTTFSTRFFLAP